MTKEKQKMPPKRQKINRGFNQIDTKGTAETGPSRRKELNLLKETADAKNARSTESTTTSSITEYLQQKERQIKNSIEKINAQGKHSEWDEAQYRKEEQKINQRYQRHHANWQKLTKALQRASDKKHELKEISDRFANEMSTASFDKTIAERKYKKANGLFKEQAKFANSGEVVDKATANLNKTEFLMDSLKTYEDLKRASEKVTRLTDETIKGVQEIISQRNIQIKNYAKIVEQQMTSIYEDPDIDKSYKDRLKKQKEFILNPSPVYLINGLRKEYHPLDNMIDHIHVSSLERTNVIQLAEGLYNEFSNSEARATGIDLHEQFRPQLYVKFQPIKDYAQWFEKARPALEMSNEEINREKAVVFSQINTEWHAFNENKSVFYLKLDHHNKGNKLYSSMLSDALKKSEEETPGEISAEYLAEIEKQASRLNDAYAVYTHNYPLHFTNKRDIQYVNPRELLQAHVNLLKELQVNAKSPEAAKARLELQKKQELYQKIIARVSRDIAPTNDKLQSLRKDNPLLGVPDFEHITKTMVSTKLIELTQKFELWMQKVHNTVTVMKELTVFYENEKVDFEQHLLQHVETVRDRSQADLDLHQAETHAYQTRQQLETELKEVQLQLAELNRPSTSNKKTDRYTRFEKLYQELRPERAQGTQDWTQKIELAMQFARTIQPLDSAQNSAMKRTAFHAAINTLEQFGVTPAHLVMNHNGELQARGQGRNNADEWQTLTWDRIGRARITPTHPNRPQPLVKVYALPMETNSDGKPTHMILPIKALLNPYDETKAAYGGGLPALPGGNVELQDLTRLTADHNNIYTIAMHREFQEEMPSQFQPDRTKENDHLETVSETYNTLSFYLYPLQGGSSQIPLEQKQDKSSDPAEMREMTSKPLILDVRSIATQIEGKSDRDLAIMIAETAMQQGVLPNGITLPESRLQWMVSGHPGTPQYQQYVTSSSTRSIVATLRKAALTWADEQ